MVDKYTNKVFNLFQRIISRTGEFVRNIACTIAVTIGLITSIVHGQETTKIEKDGLVWSFQDNVEMDAVRIDKAVKARELAFIDLNSKLKDGDPSIIELYMRKVSEAHLEVLIARASCLDESRYLESSAKIALLSIGAGIDGKMTETEYVKAMYLVNQVRSKIEPSNLTQAQKNIWENALKIVPTYPKNELVE